MTTLIFFLPCSHISPVPQGHLVPFFIRGRGLSQDHPSGCSSDAQLGLGPALSRLWPWHGALYCHPSSSFPKVLPTLLAVDRTERSFAWKSGMSGRQASDSPTEGHCSGLCSLQPPGSQGSPLWTLLCQDPSLPLSAHRQPGTPPQWPEPPTLHCLTKLAHEEGVFLKKGAAFPTKGSAPSQAGWLAATSIIHKNSFSGLITAAHTSCLPPHNHPAMKKY